MNNSIEKNIQRIQRLGLSCSINDKGRTRHFHYGREYIEIGGIKWATCNVGAEKPTDNGLFFAWGETEGYAADQVGSDEGKKCFNWENYKYGKSKPFSKYDTDEKITLDSTDDAVTMNWGIGWRMPTQEEFKILVKSTKKRWIKNYQGSGVNGILFIDKIDKSKVLFFPAACYCAHDNVSNVDGYGYYWSNSLFSDNTYYAYQLEFHDGGSFFDNFDSRRNGCTVRGVIG